MVRLFITGRRLIVSSGLNLNLFTNLLQIFAQLIFHIYPITGILQQIKGTGP